MKRYVALLIGTIIFISCIFSGCGKQPVENSTNPAEETIEGTAEETAGKTDDGNTLSVYVVQNDALYVEAINNFQAQAQDIPLDITTFRSYEAMFDVLNEELQSKGGPDVVLYNSLQGEVDAQELAKSGMFLPLEGFMDQLDPAVYPAALMDAGNIAGKQYFIPFSYNLIYAYASEQRLAEMEYSPSDSLYEAILGESEALMDVPDRVPISVKVYRPDPVNSFFDAAGIEFFDKSSGEVTVDKAALEEICRFVKLVYDNAEKNAALSGRFTRDFSGAAKSVSFFTEDVAFMNNVRYYQSMFSEKADSPMVAIPYHKLDNTQELCASIVCFGGVNANTKAPEKAYELLKYILDYDVSNGWAEEEETSEYYAPVSLTVFQKAVGKLSGNTGYGSVTIAPLTEANAEHLMESSRKITDAVIPNVALGISMEAVLEPYFTGQDSFENCYNTLLNKLQLYLSE